MFDAYIKSSVKYYYVTINIILIKLKTNCYKNIILNVCYAPNVELRRRMKVQNVGTRITELI